MLGGKALLNDRHHIIQSGNYFDSSVMEASINKERYWKIIMIQLQTIRSHCIILYSYKQEVRNAELGNLAPIFEKIILT